MSFREKIAWVCLLSTITVWSPYFTHMLVWSRQGELGAGAVIVAFIAAVVIQSLLSIIATVLISIRTRREPADERDSAVDAKSLKIAYYVLVVSGFMAVSLAFCSAITRGARPSADMSAAIIMSQLVLFCFVVAEVTRFLTQVICYRRGV
jgi:hypothetical protein